MSFASVLLMDARLIEENPSSYLASLTNFLSQEEAEAAFNMSPLRRFDFIIGRSLVRLMLAKILNITPKKILIVRERTGRPIVIPLGEGQCQFSLSHSHGFFGCAVVTEGLIGLDIEALSSAHDLDSILEKALSPCEKEQTATNLGAFEFKQRILEFWCLKEAALKSSGVEISRPLNQITFTINESKLVASNLAGLKFALLTGFNEAVVSIASSQAILDSSNVTQLTPDQLLEELRD